MQNEIVINAELGETRVAFLENNQFAELHIERARDKSVTGNVVKGRVSRVLPGMQAAFVDIGLEKAAFLYVGDYFESVLATGKTEGEPGSGRGRGGGGGRGRSRQAPPRIDTVLREGQEIVVQIAKEPIGTKGARITSSISVPGRHLVLTPWSRRVGVSRRIGSDKERRRLREIVERLRPKNLGFIIRTAGDGVREADLEADIRYLATVWAAIQQRHAEQTTPALLYSEYDLPLRIVRDLAGHETKRIVTDNKEVFDSIHGFVERFVAEPKPTVEHYEDSRPVFEKFGLEAQIHANLERKVWLKSGGSLVIDKSEALTAIDVNTGRFVGKRDLEETVFKTNLEAVEEVVHQLRFRNLGGLIIIDLIDMESAGNREKVYRALQEALRADKARTNILKISELGLVEMTRKRTRENLVQTLCEPCSYCEGRSYVLSRESVAFRVLREISKHVPKLKGRSVAVAVNPHVAEELLGRSKEALAQLSEAIGKDVEVRARPSIHQEQYELTVLEPGPPAEIELSWLKDTHPDARKDNEKEKSGEEEGKKNSRRRGGRGRGRGQSDDESKEKDSGGETLVAAGAVAEASDTPEALVTPETSTVADAKSADPAASALEETQTKADSPPSARRAKRAPKKVSDAATAAAIYERLDSEDLFDDLEPVKPKPRGRSRRSKEKTKPADGESEGGNSGSEKAADASPQADSAQDRPASPDAVKPAAASKAKSPEKLQAVDAAEESRIIPRSE